MIDHLGHVVQINVSNGGVPKRPVAGGAARITRDGVVGDRQEDTKHHGGPDRAVCLFSLEVIERLRAEGHPIAPGTVGENLTIRGIDWSLVKPGASLAFEGGVVLGVTSYTTPCSTIRASFADSDSRRIKQELHPGESRVYTRVIREGVVRTGEVVRLTIDQVPSQPRLLDDRPAEARP